MDRIDRNFFVAQIKELKRKNQILNKTVGKQGNKICKLRAEIMALNEILTPTQAMLVETKVSLNRMTAERGKWLRKLRRAGVKV